MPLTNPLCIVVAIALVTIGPFRRRCGILRQCHPIFIAAMAIGIGLPFWMMGSIICITIADRFKLQDDLHHFELDKSRCTCFDWQHVNPHTGLTNHRVTTAVGLTQRLDLPATAASSRSHRAQSREHPPSWSSRPLLSPTPRAGEAPWPCQSPGWACCAT